MMLPMTSRLISTKAEVRYNEIDRLFESTITEIFDYEQTEGGAKVEAEKEWLYDINLCELGVLYDFAYKDKEGFAIIIDDGDVKVTEIYTEGKNPYSKENVKNVYVMEGMYWYSDRGNYYESETGTEIGKETLEKVSESAYKGVEKLQYDTERVEFIYRTETPYNVLSSIPTCTYGHLGGCVPIMGTNLIVYYDKTYTNLIPNYEPGRSILGRYRFNVENETTAALTDTLQKDMGTDENGTTISEFQAGLPIEFALYKERPILKMEQKGSDLYIELDDLPKLIIRNITFIEREKEYYYKWNENEYACPWTYVLESELHFIKGRYEVHFLLETRHKSGKTENWYYTVSGTNIEIEEEYCR